MSNKRVKEEFLASSAPKGDFKDDAPEKKKPSPIPAIIFTTVVVGLIIAIVAVLGIKSHKKKNTTSETQKTAEEKVLKVGDYKTFSYHKYTTEVTDEDVKSYYSKLIQLYTAYGMTAYEKDETRSGDTVKNEDAVNIDYACYVDGVAIDGISGTGYDYAIGKGDFIDGFDDGLIGHTTGEKFDISVDIPESNTDAGALAGKTAIFTVTINYFLKSVGLNEENAAKQLFGKDSVEEAYAYLKEYLTNNPSQTEEEYKLNQINTYVRQVIDASEFADLTGEIQDHYDRLHKQYEDAAAKNDTTLEELATSTYGSLEMFEADMKEEAGVYVKSGLVFTVIGKEENITLSDETYTDMAREYAANYDFDTVDAFEENYESVFGKGTLREYIYAVYVEKEMFAKYAEEVK